MIRRLRVKMMLAAMLSLLIVGTISVGGLNMSLYRSIVNSADGMLSFLAENGGSMPAEQEPKRPPDRKPGRNADKTPYAPRYFSAEVKDGALIFADTGMDSHVDTDHAAAYAMQALDSGKEQGFVDAHRFLIVSQEGSSRILFLDCRRPLKDFQDTLTLSLGISLMGYAAVFLLLFFMSGRVARPISESYEKQRRFITNAGHELRTPITIIDADAEILEMEQGSSEWITDIRLQTARLTSLTSDLIMLSRMEEGRRAELIEIPISDLVAETASSFQAPARTRNQNFSMEIAPMLSCLGDAKAICQLVSILMDNALKYTPEGGSIGLQLEKQGRNLHLSVENSAENVSSEMLKNMFDRFYRGDASRSGNVKGYGIGLSIAKAIADAHKGRISASSPDGKSLRISVVLPG